MVTSVPPTSNTVIGFPRWTTKATFAGGAWNSTYPVTNLGILPLAKIARSSTVALSSTQFTGVMDKSYPLRLLAIIRHTISIRGLYKLTLYSDAAMTNIIYVSAWLDVWPVVYDLDDIEWEDEQWWTGQYSAAERDRAIATLPIWLDRVYVTRAFKVEIDDTTNVAGFIDIGLFEVSQGWQTSIDPAWGAASYGFQFRTLVETGLGGTDYYDQRNKHRVFRGEIDYLPRDEAMVKAFEWQRQHDKHTPFFYLPHPEEPSHWLRSAFLARHDEPALFGHVMVSRNSVPIHLREVI